MTTEEKDDWAAAEQKALETLGFGDDGQYSEIPPICFLAREIVKLQERLRKLEDVAHNHPVPLTEIAPRRSYP